MKGDFSRLTFDARRHFTAVRAQQGAVQIDADANEQADIVTHRLDLSFRDIVGDAAGPVDPDSFKVTVAANAITVSAGRYYVGGRLLENEAPLTLPVQPFLSGGYCVLADPAAPAFDLPKPPAGEYAVVLDSWVRHVTVLELPDLLEPALGGVQTGTRHQSIWQLKLMKIPNGTTCGGVLGTPAWATYASPSPARMEAGTEIPPPSPNQCDLSPSGGYQGLENDLYRVEIHDAGAAGAGAGAATFKWARDNASFVTLATSWDNDRTITIASVAGDLTRSFQIGDTVELIDVETELRERPGLMLTVADLVGDTMTLSAPHQLGAAADGAAAAARKLRVRRWEAGPLSIPKGTTWLSLGTDGVRVNLDKTTTYRTGDHWMIPARTATNDIEWPGGAQPPANIPHLLAPLARIKVDGSGNITLLSDCRTLFPPLSAMLSMLYVGGDGQQAEPNEAGNPATLALARPLTVAVMRGKLPVIGAPVRFAIVGGTGALNGGGTSAIVATGADGLASCTWALDPGIGDAAQQVEARMLDDGNAAFGNPVRFGARVFGLLEMKLAGGDTQTQVNAPGNTAPVDLDEPLRVAVTRANRPLAGALVRFTVTDGGGKVRAAGSGGAGTVTVDLQTDAQGIATCQWKLVPGAGIGRVLAQLMQNAATLWGPPDVIFSAHLIDLPKTGTSCCVTVGEDAEFATINAAVEALAKKKVRDICLCLTAGDHKLAKPLALTGGDQVNVSIHGCGRATRLHFAKFAIKATDIGTFEMADLEFDAETQVLDATGLTSVTLRGLTGRTGAYALSATKCAAVTVEDCDLEAYDPEVSASAGPIKRARVRRAGDSAAEIVAVGPARDGPVALGNTAIAVPRDLILLDGYGGLDENGRQLRIVRNQLLGAINIGGEAFTHFSYQDYLKRWQAGATKPALDAAGILVIADNRMDDLRITGAPAKQLGLDGSTPKPSDRVRVPLVARLERNEIWMERSALAAAHAFVGGNYFALGSVEELLVITPREGDDDPRAKIIGNAGEVRSVILSTGYPDQSANLPLVVVF